MVDITTKPPGVYIDEITPAGPIPGAGTSVVAMLGQVANDAAVVNVPKAITSWTDYTNKFGRTVANAPNDPYDVEAKLHLPFAVRGFIDNGGTFAYIVPIAKGAKPEDWDTALASLRPLGDVSLVCAPGVTDTGLQAKVLGHCDQMGDRFAILDGIQKADTTTPDRPTTAVLDDLVTQRGKLVSPNGFGALFWPWILTPDPKAAAGATRETPPAGHLAGIYARSDDRRGVHKAPANEPVNGALGLTFNLDDTQHGKLLNSNNINAIRLFPNRPPMVWGARTLTKDTPWQYVNVRRLVCFIEDSIVEGTRWAVFEPNNTSLWKGLERTITEFLTRVWQAGALFGATAAQAFYVRIDSELNPPSQLALGQLTIEIGLAPVRPAEYVIVRIGQWDGGARITEG